MADKESKPEEIPEKHLIERSQPNAGRFGCATGKSLWPEVVGLTAEEAEKQIKEEMPPGSIIHVVPPGSVLTMELRMNRVRIFINSDGKVYKPPNIG